MSIFIFLTIQLNTEQILCCSSYSTAVVGLYHYSSGFNSLRDQSYPFSVYIKVGQPKSPLKPTCTTFLFCIVIELKKKKKINPYHHITVSVAETREL